MDNIPQSFYIILGTIIVANIGTIVSVLYGVAKIIWWSAKIDSRVSHIETNHKKDIDNAHSLIREIKDEIKLIFKGVK